MSSSTFAGNSESGGTGFCPAPPPPPPPPPVPGQVPALRINTVEAPVPRRPLPNNNNPYEPPAAIQNAMMTKDKKPFTYTPGMGGKLDLSQIRSPRMARRVAKNANDEGIEGPPKSSLAAEPRPVSTGPNLYIQPQVAVPVFPTNVPPQPSANRTSSAPASRVPSNASDRAVEVQRPVTRVEMKPTTQVVSPQPTPPETPTTPPQVTLAKAPTPWLQNKNKPQEELPEWAKRASVNRPSSSTSPESPNSHPAQIQINLAQPQVQQTIQLQQPPLTRQHQPPPPPRQQSLAQERVIPLRIEDRPSVFSVKHEPGHHQFKQQPQPSPHHQQRWGNSTSPQTPVQAQSPQFPNQTQQQQYQQPPRPQSSGGGTYIVPIMVEGSNSNNGTSTVLYNQPQQIQARSQPVQNQSPRVIIQRGPPSPQIQQQGEPGPLQSRSFRVLQKITDTDVPDEVDGDQLRKLQLTEDDKVLMNKFKEQGRQWVDFNTDQTDREWQQPADREGSFEHTFVVDGDGTYLHQEEDPRYRGAAIPSRAFRFLQNMTESGDVTTTTNAPRAPSAINKRQNRNSRTFEESQANLPASEQQAPEPKKYTGSAIPSRSFRILQAMTSPESIAKQENRQAVVTCRTESSMQPVNQQQTLFLSSPSSYDSSSEPRAPSQSQQSQSLSSQSQPPQLQPQLPPIWQYPEGNCWWGYYPIHYSTTSNPSPVSSSSPLQLSSITANNPHNIPSYESYALCTGYHHHHHHLQDGNAFAYYHPFYDQRLYAAAISSPSCISSSSSSSFSSDTTTAAAAAAADDAAPAVAEVRQCTDISSSSLNEGALAVVSSNELPVHDTGVFFAPTSSSSTSSSSSSLSSSTSVSSRLIAARPPSTNLHPASAACFVPAFIHHKPTKESPGYDSNCNPCLERTSDAGATTIFRCPLVFVQNSLRPGEGYSGPGGRNVWPCQDAALTEPGPPPWSSNRQNTQDKQWQEISRRGEKSGEWNLDGSIGNQENSVERMGEEKLMKKDDQVSGIYSATGSAKKINWNQLEQNEDFEKSGRNIPTNLIDQNIKTENSKWKTTIAEPIADLVSEKAKWTERNLVGYENDVEILGRNRASNSVKKHEGKEDDIAKSARNIDANLIDHHETKIEEPRWNRIDNASRNVNELDAIPMNILHEERNANDSSVFNTANINERSASPDEDHYSKDGNDTEGDTETDSTSTESSVDADQICTDHLTNTDEESDSDSDTDDSDSYLAYSTGLNPHNVLMKKSSSATLNRAEKEVKKSQTATTIDEDVFDERSFAMSSDRMNSTDCESCAEEDDEATKEEATKLDEEEKANSDNFKADEIDPNRLSVILEDGEQSKIGSDGWQDVPVESPDDLATVNVSLPLRFRFSVSDNDQDVATVRIDDTVKTEEKIDESNDVCVNLKITENTNASVDFTLRRTASQEANDDDFDFWGMNSATSVCKVSDENLNSREVEIKEENTSELSKEEEEPNGSCNDEDCIDFWETLKSGKESPDFNFNSRNDKSRLEKLSLPQEISEEENAKSELKIEENLEEEEIAANNEELNCLEEDSEEEDDDEEEEEEEEGKVPDEETMQILEANNDQVSMKNNSAPQFELTEAKIEDNENEDETTSGRSNIENTKHLLSVQNSRDETDDEDSGVTSDMSRLISEVDTDSECGPTRKINGYKRTQTHSRLFRLLSREDDNAQLNDEMKNSAARRDRLSLPLKKSGFNYDESHHCSNYSSGLTSPDYSPVYESSWRRFQAEENVQTNTPEKSRSPAGLINDEEYLKNLKDPYFEIWKKSVTENMKQEEKTISSSGPLKILGNGSSVLPSWRFRTNVLCPRIKSSKNVPRTLRQNRTAKPVIFSSSTSKTLDPNSEKC